MKEKEAKELAKKFQDGLLARVKNIIGERLGVFTSYVIEVGDDDVEGQLGWFVVLKEIGGTTTKVLTSHPLLERMFDEGQIFVEIDLEDGKIVCKVMVEYGRNDRPGKDDIDLMSITFDGEEETIEY